MDKAIKFLHLVGMALFLGSIAVFTLISELIKDSTLPDLAFGRAMISSGTAFITLPGLWLVVASGLIMVFRGRGLSEGWLKLKLALAILIVLNAHFIIVPAANNALASANASIAAGSLSPVFRKALLTESVAGGINVAMAVIAMIAGVVKFGRRRQKDRETSK
ncbi:MAG: hypothetical protein HY956_00450 [Deltaproteobacteria bacterium]|nr:hypothetical protein [Deltaproteobacteria bacterium]